MVDMSGILVGLIFVAAVAGLLVVNDFDYVESSQSASDSEITEISQNSQDEITRALNDFDTKLVSFFNGLKDDLGFLNNNQI